jgi:hypothetical protein
MKTAVEWLGHEINKIYTEFPDQLFYDVALLLQKAKEMEKERVIDFAKKFSDFNGLTFNEKEVSKEYLEKLYSNQNQMKIIKTKKCDWCNKRKNIDNGYYIGKLESSKTDKEFFICVDCNLKHNIV